MPMTIEQSAERRLGTNSAETTWIINGSDDEAAALALLVGTSPVLLGTIPRTDCIVEWTGPQLFEGRVTYGQTSEIAQSDTGDTVLSLDLTGESVHLTNAIVPIAVYPPRGSSGPPDFKGAIGATEDGDIEGVDVIRPAMSFEVTYYKASVNWAYIQNLYRLTGKTNNGPVTLTASGITMTFAQRELLLLGASAGPRPDKEDWEFKLKFAARPNAENLTVGNIEGIAKKGHEYLWCYYKTDKDTTTNTVNKRLSAVYIEQVYEDGDYSGI